MERKRILIATGNFQEISSLRKSLVASGYRVKLADDGQSALVLCRKFKPHLICSELVLAKVDGHHLLRELKSQSATKLIPFVLLSHHRSVEERVHSMHLGADEYITKPFEVQEVVLRIEILLKEFEELQRHTTRASKGFSGNLTEMNLVELIQILQISEKSANIKLQNDSQAGRVYVQQGQVVDAKLPALPPKHALFRMFTWSEGNFIVELVETELVNTLNEPTEKLIRQGLEYRDKWDEIRKKLPSLSTLVEPGPKVPEESLSKEQRLLLRMLNGKTRIVDLIEQSEMVDLKALKIVYKLMSEGTIVISSEETTDVDEKGFEKISIKENSSSRMSELVSNFLKPQESIYVNPHFERRKNERRTDDERRSRHRRWNDFVSEKNNVHLNKSELLMIREKLLGNK